MNTFIILLRGINVSGHRPLKMLDLKMMLEKEGLENIETYVQSGNVVFSSTESNPQKLEKQISSAIEKTFGYNDIPIICLSADKLKKVVDQNPFARDADKDHQFIHVTFLDGEPKPEGKGAIEEKKREGEEISYRDDVVYLYCPRGYGTSKLTNSFLENKLKVTATTRNWKTTNKLLEIAGKMD